MSAGGGHEHQADTGGPDDGAPDWFQLLDILVWVSVALIAMLAVEWLIGYMVRERLARGADRYLAKVSAGKASPPEATT